jgi:hypothetical protein
VYYAAMHFGAGFVFRHHCIRTVLGRKPHGHGCWAKAKLRLFGPGFGLETIGIGVGHKQRLGEL